MVAAKLVIPRHTIGVPEGGTDAAGGGTEPGIPMCFTLNNSGFPPLQVQWLRFALSRLRRFRASRMTVERSELQIARLSPHPFFANNSRPISIRLISLVPAPIS
jgi:hypothetical protein